jgi:hypothetical protein
MKLRHLAFLLPVVALTGCDNDITGTFTAYSTIELKDKDKKLVQIQPGSIEMNIDPEDAGNTSKQVIKLNFKDAAGKKRQVKLSAKGVILPTYSGSFVVPAHVSGQNIDFAANVDTQESDSGQSHGTESCTFYTYERVCRQVQHQRPDGTWYWTYECHYENVAHIGSKEVITHQHYTQVTAHADFNAPGSSQVLGSFAGTRSYSQTVYDYVGDCRGGFYPEPYDPYPYN